LHEELKNGKGTSRIYNHRQKEIWGKYFAICQREWNIKKDHEDEWKRNKGNNNQYPENEPNDTRYEIPKAEFLRI